MNELTRCLETYHVHCISGREEILRHLPRLERVAASWGQQPLVQELPFYLSVPHREPVLVLLSGGSAPSSDLTGGVFLFAYGHALLGKRLLGNADRFGRIGVFGPVGQRLQIAAAATRFLLQNGTVLVRLTFSFEVFPEPEVFGQDRIYVLQRLRAENPEAEWDVQSHDLFFNLTLHLSLDNTLSQLGRRTRRNIRDAMRKCVAERECRFFVNPNLTLEEFLALNRRAARPVSSRVARFRHTQSRISSAFLSGIQAADGRWLCLGGGRISGDTVLVEWQMNDLFFARYSPSLLLRAYLMQHFGERGMQFLIFSGGTAHRMARHFNKRTVHFLHARQPVVWLNFLQKLMLRWLPAKAVTKVLFGHG